MRRLFLFFLAGSFSLMLCSCLIIEQNLALNKNGSGVMTMKVDMGEMMSNPLMAMVMAEEQESDEPTEKIDSTYLIVDELLEYNPQWTAEEIAMLKKAKAQITMDMQQGIMLANLSTPFESLEELYTIKKLFSEANKPPEDDGELMVEGDEEATEKSNPMNSFLTPGSDKDQIFKLSGKELSVESFFGEAGSDMMGLGEMEETERNMMMGMLEGGQMIYTFTLPSKVKKVKGFQGAEVDGNTVTVSFDLLEYYNDLTKTSELVTGTIKY